MKALIKSFNMHVHTLTFLLQIIKKEGLEGPKRRLHGSIVKSPMSHVRSSLERKSALIIKTSISNESSINNLHD